MGEIRRNFRDNGMIKVSRKIQSDWRKVRTFMRDFECEFNREPRVDEILQGTGLDYDEVILALNATLPPISLTPPEDGPELIIQDNTDECEVKKMELIDVIKNLECNEKRLIFLRFFQGMTQVKTAELLNMNQVKISRLEKKAKEKLKKQLHI